MIGISRVRAIHRRLNAGVLWAMIPLAAWSGIPTARCACVNCHCGAQCGIGSHSATGCSPASDSVKKTDDCSCCCGHSSSADGCCCCHPKQPTPMQETCRRLPGNGFDSQSPHSCRMAISAVAGVQATMVVVSDHQPLAMDVLAPSASSQTNHSALDRGDAFDTGPPVDLVVTLRRLVI
jgi:hypothetical protein